MKKTGLSHFLILISSIPKTALLFFLGIAMISCGMQEAGQYLAVRNESELHTTAERVQRNYADKELLSYGILDVTKKPYSIDNSGNRDVTDQLQKALNDARDSRSVLFLPAGTYKVSGTVEGIQGTIEWKDWSYEGFADPWLKYASFEYPNVIVGSATGERTLIQLADSSLGFSDKSSPQPILKLWSRMEYGDIDKSKPQPNINFNQKIIDLDFDLGKGNPGAFAIEHQGAEGSVIEDVRINAEGAYAGICRAPGSGGAIHGIQITGGEYGLYIRNDEDPRRRGSQPSPLISSLLLRKQIKASVLFDGRGPLTIVGADIEGAPVVSVAPYRSASNGPINIIDSKIRVPCSKAAVKMDNHPLVLDNVFIQSDDLHIQVGQHYHFRNKSTSWLHFINASIIPDSVFDRGSFVNYTEAGNETEYVLHSEDTIGVRTFNPYFAHHWTGDFPSWQSSKAVNVKQAPYYAKGDGSSDDYHAIQQAIDENELVFLPKGIYAISKSLVLKSSTKLIGIGNIQSVITSIENGSDFIDPNNPSPLVETVNDSSASTVLAFIKLLVPTKNPCVYALKWRAGKNSLVRNVYPVRDKIHPHGTAMNYPMIRIEGAGGGKWYTNVLLHWWDQGPDYRHLLINGTQSPLAFYMLEPQHGRGTTMVEILNSRNIDIFSMKSEGDFGVLTARNSEDFRIFGYSGNGNPYAGYELFNLVVCKDFLLANICPMYKGKGSYGALGIAHDPMSWSTLKVSDSKDNIIYQLPGNRHIALYKSEN
jgi:hypothetical protein